MFCFSLSNRHMYLFLLHHLLRSNSVMAPLSSSQRRSKRFISASPLLRHLSYRPETLQVWLWMRTEMTRDNMADFGVAWTGLDRRAMLVFILVFWDNKILVLTDFGRRISVDKVKVVASIMLKIWIAWT
ncbi:unnamed protein product [Vicia faba]|uniref:Uncharacterized protein n=1 Tax=Vicia faba TaxID=3906 RepID=A0AAV1ALS1_VICFA|nr:unnamed protein product [Vicia faba]